MISMSVPGVAQMIQVVLINFIYFDVLFTEYWFPQLMDYMKLDINFEDHPLNSYFDENGFSSLSLVKNMGSTLFFILLYAFSWVLLLFLKLVSNFSTFIDKIKQKFQSLLMWKATIRFIILQFTPILMSSLLNLQSLSWDTNVKLISSILSITLIAFLSIAIIFFSSQLWAAYKDESLQQSLEFKQKFDSLTEGLKHDSQQFRLIKLYWKIINLIRWLITIIVLVYFKDNPTLQIFVFITFSIIMQSLIITANPYSSKSDNNISLFNEISVSLYLYIMTLLSDQMGILTSSQRETLGWALAILLCIVVVINIFKGLLTITSRITEYIKQKCAKKKNQTIKLQPTLIEQNEESIIANEISNKLSINQLGQTLGNQTVFIGYLDNSSTSIDANFQIKQNVYRRLIQINKNLNSNFGTQHQNLISGGLQ